VPPIIASVSGVRGIMGDSLTPQNIIKFISAFAEYLKKTSKTKTIVVGRDGRLHGDVVEAIVISTLRMCGYNVINIGIAPTPTVQIATEDTEASGGISITASHNPQIWNGLKFLNADGTFLDAKQIDKFLTIASKGAFKYADIDNIGKLSYAKGWTDKHIEKVLKLKLINIKKIKHKKLKVVVDAVNASGSDIVPKLLKKLGCKVIPLYCDGSGVFPHMPEPLPHNLKALCKAVKSHHADLGISVDPDADRLVLITDKGQPYGEENTIATVVNYVLKNSGKSKKDVTVNLSTTRAVEDVALRYGGKVSRSPVGEINVVKLMQINSSVVGGEGSGGIILPELHYGRDAMVGIALVLAEFAGYKGSVSDYKKHELPQYHISKDKMENVKDPDGILKKVIAKYKNENCRISIIDGVKLDFPGYWIHLRKSNTEPIIRIITEAPAEKEASKIQSEFIASIKKL
jgi:phosphomannomutase